jgi:hypothetical protein
MRLNLISNTKTDFFGQVASNFKSMKKIFEKPYLYHLDQGIGDVSP